MSHIGKHDTEKQGIGEGDEPRWIDLSVVLERSEEKLIFQLHRRRVLHLVLGVSEGNFYAVYSFESFFDLSFILGGDPADKDKAPAVFAGMILDRQKSVLLAYRGKYLEYLFLVLV